MKMKTAGAAVLLWFGLVVVAANVKADDDCEPNIEPALEEMKQMSALVAKQSEAMEAMEKKAEAMETRLRASEREVEKLKSYNQAKETALRLTESKVEELRREREKRMVAFSTSLTTSGVRNIGPHPDAIVLDYKHVITNVGNAYNPHTGLFTAPVRGVYHFLIFAVGFGHASTYTAVYLQKNGQQVVIASGQQPTGRVDTSNAASLLLEVGDVVSVNLYPQAWVHDSYNHHTTFSGHLLFPM